MAVAASEVKVRENGVDLLFPSIPPASKPLDQYTEQGFANKFFAKGSENVEGELGKEMVLYAYVLIVNLDHPRPRAAGGFSSRGSAFASQYFWMVNLGGGGGGGGGGP